ncbi:MAG: tetratricopeptide repeat-containing glycosyltransferase family protein [Pseudomonadota bacterium]
MIAVTTSVVRLLAPERTLKQGVALHQAGQLREALLIYDRILSVDANNFVANHLKGVIFYQQKKYLKAIPFIRRAIEINSQIPDAYSNLGLVLNALTHHEEALANFDTAISLRADYAQAHNNRAIALVELARPQEAIASYQKAISLQPNNSVTFFNLGKAQQDGFLPEEALESYGSAISLNPHYVEALNNRGNVLKGLGRIEEAISHFQRAVAIKPDYVSAYVNWGNGLLSFNRLADAIATYGKAIAITSDNADAYLGQAVALLLQGDYESGLRIYEWRWHHKGLKQYQRNFERTLWLGVEPLSGRTILLHAEQGLGDTIQFCRYVQLLIDLGARVVLEVQGSLLGLMRSLPSEAVLISKGDALPAFDYHCPLLSLPLALKTTITSIPNSQAYLRADARALSRWNGVLGEKKFLRVGLAWSGNPTHSNDRTRSIALADLMAHLPAGLEYVCLQKDIRSTDLAMLQSSSCIRYFGDAIRDFSDTAALCELMDVVVSVDTSIAHLGGAMGRPTWIMLPYHPDWRWLLERDDSPWYPSVSLYRQPALFDWSSVLAKVRVELEKLAEEPSTIARLREN